MITTPFGETVTLHRRTVSGYDSLGSPIWATQDVPIKDSVIQPEQGNEEGGSQSGASSSNTATGRLLWFAPPGTSVKVPDRVTVRGDLYEVDGPPLDFGRHAITGARGRVQVVLRRST